MTLTAEEKRGAGFAAVIALPMAGLRLGIRIEDDAVSEIDFLLPGTPRYRMETPPAGIVARRCAEQLRRYFADPSFRFTLPLAPRGSVFQRRVWAELAAIPPGQVRRYGEIARRLRTSARAVGAACRTNPLPIVVPCHRVVAADGMGGYSGATTGELHDIKSWLLAHEGYRNGSAHGGRAAATG
jgi:methylated-DNA-[protein]-cysteine S-methyltransferase